MKNYSSPIYRNAEESVNPDISTDNAALMEKLVNLVFYRIDNGLDLPS